MLSLAAVTPLRFTTPKPKPALQTFLGRVAGWTRRLWKLLCPWEPGDIPELEALYAPPHRPPAGQRHRSGRRTSVETEAPASVATTTPAKSPGFALTVSATSLSTRRR
jgi:hypothetical protein